jgi:hypothetical protein
MISIATQAGGAGVPSGGGSPKSPPPARRPRRGSCRLPRRMWSYCHGTSLRSSSRGRSTNASSTARCWNPASKGRSVADDGARSLRATYPSNHLGYVVPQPQQPLVPGESSQRSIGDVECLAVLPASGENLREYGSAVGKLRGRLVSRSQHALRPLVVLAHARDSSGHVQQVRLIAKGGVYRDCARYEFRSLFQLILMKHHSRASHQLVCVLRHKWGSPRDERFAFFAVERDMR